MPLFEISVLVLVVVGLFTLLRTRTFYFVRHGETERNAAHVRQGEEGALSDRGRAQAFQVGAYLQKFPVESVLASSYPRAIETANIIGKAVGAPVRASRLLVERRNPSEVVGKRTDDPHVLEIDDQMDLAYHDDDFRISDEENFVDLKRRARKCLRLLALQGAPHTIVVTHHVFLKMLVAYMLYREALHSSDFVKLSFFNYSDNAGITVCTFNPLDFFTKTRGWHVVAYNEHII